MPDVSSHTTTNSAMERDYEDEFILRSDNGLIHLKINEVFGFPDTTCPWGGYDTKSTIEIISSNYSAKGEVYISTGELYEFYEQLKTCYKTLQGNAELLSYEGNLKMKVSFDGIGHATIKGSYKEHHHEDNELLFELASDQTYIFQAVSGLEDIISVYGNNLGVK